MATLTIILKPTDECNFRCKYCYHSDTGYEKGYMSEELFEQVVKKTFPYYNRIVLIFHGGEPLLMGKPFFENAIRIIEKYKRPELEVNLGVQTNGSLLDDEYMELFQKNGIVPSISFDGPKDMNSLRDGTEILEAKILEMKNRDFRFNLIGVINKQNIDKLLDYYLFAKSNHTHLKLNPIFKSGAAIDNQEFLIDPKEYCDSLQTLFKYWLSDENPVGHFDPLIKYTEMALLGRGRECTYSGCLTRWVSVNHNGDIYPCGRSYTIDYCLGNIKELNNITECFETNAFRSLLEKAIIRRSNCMKECQYYPICNGGCNNDALLSGDISKPSGFSCVVLSTMIPFIIEYTANNKDKIKNPEVIQLLKRRMKYGKHYDY